MPKLVAEQHEEQIKKANEELTKRYMWIMHMPQEPTFSTIRLDQYRNEKGNDVDGRDIFALANLIEYEGVTEEDKEIDFKKKVFLMNQAFSKGDNAEIEKILNKMYDVIMNFDADSLDFNKTEDVYKALALASLNQCFGTKRKEFRNVFLKRFNTPELQEKFFYKEMEASYLAEQYLNEAAKKVHLPSSVTLNSLSLATGGHEGATKLSKTIMERDIQQYHQELNGNHNIIPLEFELAEGFKDALDETKGTRDIATNMDISFMSDIALTNEFMPNGVEGANLVNDSQFRLNDAILINGRPLMEDTKESRFNDGQTQMNVAATANLAKRLMEPTTMVEICKFIPLGNNQFKKVIIPVHRDFSKINPDLQKEHDEKFNKYIAEETAESRKEKLNLIEKRYQEKVEKFYFESSKRFAENEMDRMVNNNTFAQEMRVGERSAWETYDKFEINEEAYFDFERKFATVHKFFENYSKVNTTEYKSNDLHTDDLRAGNAIAIFLCGPHATMDQILAKRVEVTKALRGSKEEAREFKKNFIRKCIDYRPENVNFNDRDSTYEFLAFTASASAISNFLQEDESLENELYSGSVEDKNHLSTNCNFTLYSNMTLCGKLIEKYGGYVKDLGNGNLFHMSHMSQCDDTLTCLEYEKMHMNLGFAKAKALNGEGVATLTLPYFLSGNGFGGDLHEVYDESDAMKTYDDYMDMHNIEDRFGRMVFSENNVKNADIGEYAIATGAGFYAKFASVNSNHTKDAFAEYCKVSGGREPENTALMETLYINGTSLKELFDDKFNKYIRENNVNYEELPTNKKNEIDTQIRNCLLAEALMNPNKILSMVVLSQDENNLITPKVTLLKKDYSAMVKNAEREHGFGRKILHFFGMKYDEEKTAKTAERLQNKFIRENKGTDIIEDFKLKCHETLAKHQSEYAKTKELRVIALKELYPDDPKKQIDKEEVKSSEFIKGVRTDMMNEKPAKGKKPKEFSEPSSRPDISLNGNKKSKVSEVFKPTDNAVDLIEENNFNSKFKKVEIDLEEPKEENVQANASEKEFSIQDVLSDDELEI